MLRECRKPRLNLRFEHLFAGGADHTPRRSLGGCPNRGRKVAIFNEARDHMPVQMRGHIAQRGQVDFVGLEAVPQCRLNCEDRMHKIVTIGGRKIGHFTHMRVPDDTAKTGIIGFVDPNDAHAAAAPENFASIALTKITFSSCAQRHPFAS
jgi:hypothetical protein